MLNPLAAINARVATMFGGYHFVEPNSVLQSGVHLINPDIQRGYYCVQQFSASTVQRLSPEWDKFLPDYIGNNDTAFELLKNLRLAQGALSFTSRPLGTGLWNCKFLIHTDDERDHFEPISEASHESMATAIVAALLLETKDFKRELGVSDKSEEWQSIAFGQSLQVYFHDEFGIMRRFWKDVTEGLRGSK